ncbi:HAD family hydrolase [Limnoglobus roseus]|uniref:phosphoglycolate phosphatase n=1 Tax=Limnoglobus roseus TaxID=2598579 RepID=A0A5C1AJ51_9BACT|nr:HAD-IA family hydrolase [Limnoglobus roseus]QEL18187.1 HAD family phosphatase [Limnoglobus roseus]
MPIRAALFDFDGTLADSFVAITASTNHVRQLYGLPALAEDTVRSYVGLGLTNLMENLVPNAPPAAAVAAYRDHHPSVMAAGTRLFPGVLPTLEELHARGIRLAVCSNKRTEFTKALVRDLKLGHLFDEILGPDDVGIPKPDPAMLVEAMRRLGVPAAETVYVGDMVIDVEVAKAAGVPGWVVLGGASSREDLEAARPDHLLKEFTEIAKLIPS